MWMNESEIDDALDIVGRNKPRFLPYVKFLSDWRHIVNQNSDGWPYWKAGAQTAVRLMEGVERIVESIRSRNTSEPSTRDLDRTLTPIRIFAKKHKLPVPIIGGEAAEKASKPASDDDTEDPARRKKIMELASNNRMLRDGELELDQNAKISEGDSNGAYVQTWMWVPFSGTELDKEA